MNTHRSNRSRPARRGVSLLEMLVTMSVSSIVLTLAVGMIHLMLQAQRRQTDELQAHAALARLSRDFRADAATARGARLSDDGTALTLTPADGAARTWSVQGDRLERRAGDAAAGETYRVPAGTWTLAATDRFVSVDLVIPASARSYASPGPARHDRITAQLGRHAPSRSAP